MNATMHILCLSLNHSRWALVCKKDGTGFQRFLRGSTMLKAWLPLLLRYYYVARVEGGSTQNWDFATASAKHCCDDDANGGWFLLFPDVQERVEAAYQRYAKAPTLPGASSFGQAVPALPVGLPDSMTMPPSPVVSFNIDNPKYEDGVVYEIRFDASPMTQRNTKTGFERRVMRKPKSYTWKKPDTATIEKILKNKASRATAKTSAADLGPAGVCAGRAVVGVSYLALDKTSAEDGARVARSEISSKFKVQSLCIPLPDHALSGQEEDEVRGMLAQLPVKVEVRSFAKSSNIQLTGLAADMDAAKEKIVESRLYQVNSKYTFPDTWSSSATSHNAVVDVDSTSAEFHSVAAKFAKDLPDAAVSRVQRVENVLLYKAYQGNARILHERYSVNGQRLYGDEELTKELWHGTSLTAPEVVVLSSYGTERCHSNDKCMWGQGNYFSTTATYVNNGYAHSLPAEGLKQMVLFEVMVGLSCNTDSDRSIKKPPPVPADHDVMRLFGSAAPPNLSYDSVTGVTMGTRVYITYSTGVAQQYPRYIVTYKPA